MTKTQAVLGLCKRKIEFCAICNLKFNITNPRDIEFHKKLHNKMKIPKAIQLSKNFYRKYHVSSMGLNMLSLVVLGLSLVVVIT